MRPPGDQAALCGFRDATWRGYPGDSVVQLILIVIAIALAFAPVVVIVQTVGWIIGQHSFPDGDAWIAAGVGVVVWIIALAVMLNPGDPAREPRQRRKRYVMRGYGGGKNATASQDEYAFTTTASGTLQAAFSSCTSGLGYLVNWKLVNNETGATVFTTTACSTKTISGLAAGVYRIIVTRNGRTGTYALTLSLQP